MIGWRAALGLGRSLAVYRLRPMRRRRLARLYAPFVRPGDLVFDIGAHLGDRVAAFRSLGARVVAVEPQPAAIALLRRLHGGDDGIEIVAAAVGAAEGSARLHINARNPSVSTLSDDLIMAAARAPGWRRQRWDEIVEVPVTRLDTLIGRFGRPAFVKLDVEGFEAEALAGLSEPVPALSFEITTIQRGVAVAAIDRLEALARYGYDIVLGERRSPHFGEPVDADAMKAHIAALPDAANSGDVYAIRRRR